MSQCPECGATWADYPGEGPECPNGCRDPKCGFCGKPSETECGNCNAMLCDECVGVDGTCPDCAAAEESEEDE